MITHHEGPWLPIFDETSKDRLEETRPIDEVVNVLFIRAIDRGFGYRLEPVTGRVVFFSQAEHLATERVKSPRVARMMRRLREMAEMSERTPVSSGRVLLRFGPERAHSFAVQGREARTHRRMVVSELAEVPGRIDLTQTVVLGAQSAYEAASTQGEAAFAGGDLDTALSHFELAHEAARPVDTFMSAAALDRWCTVLLARDGEPDESFERLFTYLDETFGAFDPTTLGWKASIAESVLKHLPAPSKRLWMTLRDPFVVVFGEDDDTARTLDAR